MGRKKSIIPGFSLNRALGITSAKQKIARATGIPTTKQGHKRKMQNCLWTAVAAGVAAAFAAKEDDDFWVLPVKAGIHGGPAYEDEDYEDRSYGVHMTVKLASPAEREARHMWVDDEGNLYQDPEVETTAPPKQSTAQSAKQTVADTERTYVEKHRIVRRNVLLTALVVCVVFYALCMIYRLLF